VPLTIGFLIVGPVSGWLSDRFGARSFATGGMVIAAGSFVWLAFDTGELQLLGVRRGIAAERDRDGLFAAPNRAGIMNSLPPSRRGSVRG
jgi:MFS family permease